MSAKPTFQRGLYFEEFEVGQQIITAARTVTESDVVSFAGLSGDYNSIHIDAKYSEAGPFGQRVAHGLLVLSIASGLVQQTGMMNDTVMAFREINNWKFTKPIFIGDTVQVMVNIKETKALPRIGGGSVSIELDVRNQDEDTVMKGTWTALFVSQPEEE
ncbi:MAG: dehydratase [Chloroflexi bacterium]|nr:MAG: dehydratase [Chloroflexota bacterium]MBL1195345.1 dehydratase [Chloroflexota bacterium]NOH12629.1 dehydratase [Chloroflexota bacterium]